MPNSRPSTTGFGTATPIGDAKIDPGERGVSGWEVRDKGIFVKMIFEFNESRVKLSHQLKMHVRGTTLSNVNIPFTYTWIPLTVRI